LHPDIERGARPNPEGAAGWLAAATFIAFPASTTTIARGLGIGRGADLILYLAILAGMGASLYFYVRFRRVELALTGLMRREALRTAIKGARPAAATGVPSASRRARPPAES
jgi:hypothetical protein